MADPRPASQQLQATSNLLGRPAKPELGCDQFAEIAQGLQLALLRAALAGQVMPGHGIVPVAVGMLPLAIAPMDPLDHDRIAPNLAIDRRPVPTKQVGDLGYRQPGIHHPEDPPPLRQTQPSIAQSHPPLRSQPAGEAPKSHFGIESTLQHRVLQPS
jgi:hypothetical protein